MTVKKLLLDVPGEDVMSVEGINVVSVSKTLYMFWLFKS